MLILIISVSVGLMLFGMGFLLSSKNAPTMISGYKKLSEEERNQMKLSEYIDFFKIFHFTVGLLIVVLSIVFYLIKLIDFIGFTLVFFSLAGYTFFIFKSQFYYPPQRRKPFIISFYVMLIVSIGVLVMFIVPYQKTDIEIFNNQLKISGIYGEEIPIDQIQSFQIIDELPAIKIKTNGFAMNNLKKGWFKTWEGEKVKLIIDDMNGPFLQIESDQKFKLILGLENLDEELLFEQLRLIKN